MAFLETLEKRFRKYGIPNVTLYLIAGQGIMFMMGQANPQMLERIYLKPALVLQGEVWRLITFLFMPPTFHPIFLFFALYLFYLMGTALENYWGTIRYNLFLLIGYVATVAVSFLQPYSIASPAFLAGSIFLAFATLNPNFELMIFFILPVKIKWLALLTWIGYFWTMIVGDWLTRLLILASVANYLIFFSRDIWLRMRSGRWRMERQAKEFSRKNDAVHRCVICGATDKDHPELTFRYCTKCAGTPCYCQEHLKNHDHLSA
ncbi:hypothetical protein U14_02361 [Candidatus Moduliflexus flocculans]|uniref:Peptidase S54 rhomboid domain-containing protein n=1 Tax=Candidatus Moduliflexus flocculans TaxID=1499966 RepID=A0A0S6VYD4_9BACT|nr:hypothetical protein U14_02361 [Candidatus Moduliflexus flocculans]